MLDILSLSIAIGLAVSLLFSETLGRGSGGLVVPGYVALYLTRPVDVLLTVLAALATYAVVYWIAQHLIVYGRRRTVLMLLTGFIFGMIARALSGMAWEDTHLDVAVIGYIIPGLLAIWFDRQGLFDTLTTMLTASAVVRLALILVAATQLQQTEIIRRDHQKEMEMLPARPIPADDVALARPVLTRSQQPAVSAQ